MKVRNFLLMTAAMLICTASISASTITHTWVSGSGLDSNACTFAAPCATFQGALGKTSAGGIITAKDAGDFGTLIISQSVTIDGNNLGSITAAAGTLISIAGGAYVTVQNLTINGMGTADFGINATGGIVIVDNCKIKNILEDDLIFSGTGTLTVENSRIESFSGTEVYGIEIYSNAAENIILKNTVIDASTLTPNDNVGLFVGSGAGPVKASLQNVTILGAGAGAVLAYSGVTEITGSILTQSTCAVQAANGSTVSVANSLITANTVGVCSAATSKIRLDNNDIYDNTIAINNCSGIVKTSGTNKTSGTIAILASDVSESVTF